MESFPFEDRIQERIQSYRRRPGCRTAFYLLATFVISEGFCRVAQGYYLTERTIILSVCCMGGFPARAPLLLRETARWAGGEPLRGYGSLRKQD